MLFSLGVSGTFQHFHSCIHISAFSFMHSFIHLICIKYLAGDSHVLGHGDTADTQVSSQGGEGKNRETINKKTHKR